MAVRTAAAELRSPDLTLDGFSGPLAELLTLARAQRIDLARLSLSDVLDQLTAALQHAPSLTQKADWLVMAAWLVQIRSRLLAPDDPESEEAQTDAKQLRGRLLDLQTAQTLAGWLDRRPVLGRDCFPRGRSEFVGVSAAETYHIDVVEILWNAMALFDDDLDAPESAERYRPARPELYSVAEARDRILSRLTVTGEGILLDRLLPTNPPPENNNRNVAVLQRSAWSSTFTACLELAKQGDVRLEQSGHEFVQVFQTIGATYEKES